jgi:hydrogenase nickel incorporation protein HypA/HybF
MGIALEIHRICCDAVRDHGSGRIENVRVAVGELSAVEPELLGFAWEAVVADTRHAGSRIDVVWCPATQRCSRCGEIKERVEGSWLRICPDCGLPLEVTGGSELDVLEVTFLADDDLPDESVDGGSTGERREVR